VLVNANVHLKLFAEAQCDVTGTVKVRAVLNVVGVGVKAVDGANGEGQAHGSAQ